MGISCFFSCVLLLLFFYNWPLARFFFLSAVPLSSVGRNGNSHNKENKRREDDIPLLVLTFLFFFIYSGHFIIIAFGCGRLALTFAVIQPSKKENHWFLYTSNLNYKTNTNLYIANSLRISNQEKKNQKGTGTNGKNLVEFHGQFCLWPTARRIYFYFLVRYERIEQSNHFLRHNGKSFILFVCF